jgi:hypothetical protein
VQWRVTNTGTNKGPLGLLLNQPLQDLLPALGLFILLPEPLFTKQVQRSLPHEIFLIDCGTLDVKADGLVHQEVEQFSIPILASLMEHVPHFIIG